jgi:GDP-L-fucose synthase
LEPTHEAYALAKIVGLTLAGAYRRQEDRDVFSAMPTNLYGPGDNFDLASSHVLPALMRKAHEAKLAGAGEMTVWGTGSPRREFLHVDDCADALVFLMTHYSDALHINVGCGEDQTIATLAQGVANAVGFKGALRFDASKPDGMPRKLLDISRLRSLGWAPRIRLVDGLAATYDWFLRHITGARSAA